MTPDHPAYGVKDKRSSYLPDRGKRNKDQTKKGERSVLDHADYWYGMFTHPAEEAWKDEPWKQPDS